MSNSFFGFITNVAYTSSISVISSLSVDLDIINSSVNWTSQNVPKSIIGLSLKKLYQNHKVSTFSRFSINNASQVDLAKTIPNTAGITFVVTFTNSNGSASQQTFQGLNRTINPALHTVYSSTSGTSNFYYYDFNQIMNGSTSEPSAPYIYPSKIILFPVPPLNGVPNLPIDSTTSQGQIRLELSIYFNVYLECQDKRLDLQVCREYCLNNKEQCLDQMNSYCSHTMTPNCRDFYLNLRQDYDAMPETAASTITDYCKTAGITTLEKVYQSETDRKLCACYLDESVYDKYLTDLVNIFGPKIEHGADKYCTLSECATSRYRRSNCKIPCINLVTIKGDSVTKEDINIDQSFGNNCGTVKTTEELSRIGTSSENNGTSRDNETSNALIISFVIIVIILLILFIIQLGR